MRASAVTPGKSSRRSAILSTTSGVVSVSTGTGWYGEPFQHGLGTSASQGVIRRASSSAGTLTSRDSRARTAVPPSASACSSLRLTDTTSVLRFVTSGRPRSSTIAPRGAGRITSRVCCRFAVWTSRSSSSTCR